MVQGALGESLWTKRPVLEEMIHRLPISFELGAMATTVALCLALPISSGKVESAHRHVPQARLQLPGACWHPTNVNCMLALRVIRANGWWDDFWQWCLR